MILKMKTGAVCKLSSLIQDPGVNGMVLTQALSEERVDGALEEMKTQRSCQSHHPSL
jgi:endonuclease III-like uncharacterized protein